MKKEIEPTPDNFESYEAAAEFWDNHDTTDYLEEFSTIDMVSEFRGRHFEVEIDQSVAQLLRAKAKKEGVSASYLASELLRRQLDLVA